MVRRRASDQHEALLRLADSLRQHYRRIAAAAHSVCRRPPSLLAPLGRAVALLKGPAAYLGRRGRGSSRGEAKVESHACVLGICICVRLFNVVDALRLAVSGLTMPRRSRSSPLRPQYNGLPSQSQCPGVCVLSEFLPSLRGLILRRSIPPRQHQQPLCRQQHR